MNECCVELFKVTVSISILYLLTHKKNRSEFIIAKKKSRYYNKMNDIGPMYVTLYEKWNNVKQLIKIRFDVL